MGDLRQAQDPPALIGPHELTNTGHGQVYLCRDLRVREAGRAELEDAGSSGGHEARLCEQAAQCLHCGRQARV